jgi:DNA-binding beta-propeller fold protein YncE
MLKKASRLISIAILAAAMVAPAIAADLRFEHVMNIGSAGAGEGQFGYVEDFAFSKDGHLLVTDASHAWVQVFDATTGKFLTRFGGKGDLDDQLDKPEGIAVDPQGHVFVADYRTGFIKKYDPRYRWLATFSEYGSAPGQNMRSEFMDIHDGRLYVPDTGNHRVNVFDLDGAYLFYFGRRGRGAGEFDTPEAVKFNSEGKLYLTDLKNDRIQIFDKDGTPLGSFGSTGSAAGELKAPAGLAFDKHDNIYVTELGNNRVQVFDKAGRFLAMWSGSATGAFGNPHGIIVERSSGTVYVADTANNRVQVFRPADAGALVR